MDPHSFYSVYGPSCLHCPPGTVQTAQPGSQSFPPWFSGGLSSNCFHVLPCTLTVGRSALSLSLIYTFLTCLCVHCSPPKISFYPFPIPSSGSAFSKTSSPHHPFLTSRVCTITSFLHLLCLINVNFFCHPALNTSGDGR